AFHGISLFLDRGPQPSPLPLGHRDWRLPDYRVIISVRRRFLPGGEERHLPLEMLPRERQAVIDAVREDELVQVHRAPAEADGTAAQVEPPHPDERLIEAQGADF